MPELDRIIHQPIRLRIMSALTALEKDAEADFIYLRDLLGVTEGNLGSHLLKLEHAGYIKQTKIFERRKPRTFISMTRRGRRAFEDHVVVLQAILKGES